MGIQAAIFDNTSDSFKTPPPRDGSLDPGAVVSDGIQPLPPQHSMYKHHVLSVNEFTKEKVNIIYYTYIDRP